jgi:hypothetical protein
MTASVPPALGPFPFCRNTAVDGTPGGPIVSGPERPAKKSYTWFSGPPKRARLPRGKAPRSRWSEEAVKCKRNGPSEGDHWSLGRRHGGDRRRLKERLWRGRNVQPRLGHVHARGEGRDWAAFGDVISACGSGKSGDIAATVEYVDRDCQWFKRKRNRLG